MSTDYTIYLPLLLIAFGITMQLLPRVRAWRARGRSLQELEQRLGRGRLPQRLILYFWSHHCFGCQAMKPILAQLSAAEQQRIFAFDAVEQPELMQWIGLSGVPATVFIEQGVVQKVHLGMIAPQVIRQFLAE